MILLEARFARTLEALVARFAGPQWQGVLLEAWVFEDADARCDARDRLAAQGITARVRSAYKPLLHAWLEDGLPPGPIRLPAHPQAAARRFALEAYPLAALMPVAPDFIPGERPLDYVLADRTRVFAPNRVVPDAHGEDALCCCGWLRVWKDDVAVIDEWLPTEFEAVQQAVMAAVRGHDWRAAGPFFPVLHIEVETGGICRPLELGHECIDTQEALQEDLYFGVLELFQARAGLARGDRRLQPGQIVPEIRRRTGDTRLRIAVVPRLADAAPLGPMSVDTAARALDPGQIAAVFAALPGTHFKARSVQGREVAGLYSAGERPGLVVTAGQHANETSGVVGLLRAAAPLLSESGARIGLVALENPDGYALHRRLCATHPHQMHHAARYTALGDDLEARQAPPFYEDAARREAIELTGARLHLSLHGYPAQEWTRPLAGYVPQGFADWTLPCGFFLIMRHHPGLAGPAHGFLEALTAEIARDPVLVGMNRAQLALRRAHGGGGDALVLNDIACRVSESTRSPVPYTLISEYPDETITGPDFVQAHTVQCRTVLAAARLLWAGML